MKLDRRGAILMTSLWILTILSILAIGIGFRISLELRLARSGMERVKALYLAKAGVERAREVLAGDTNNFDSLFECGVDLTLYKKNLRFSERLAALFERVKLGEGSFRVGYMKDGEFYPGMTDEERKININTAPEEVLRNLLGQGTEALVISILYWRGALAADTTGEENYYNTLEHPYACRKAKFACVEELLLVRNMTREIYNNIKDYITVYGDVNTFSININTAPQKVLAAIGMSENRLAQDVISYRKGPDGKEGTQDDNIFIDQNIEQSMGFLPIEEQNELVAIKSKISFTIKSNYFRIEAKGVLERSNTGKSVTCVVDRGNSKLVYYHEY